MQNAKTKVAAVLEDFDVVVLADAIRVALNTNGKDDFPTIKEVENENRAVMADLKERLTTLPGELVQISATLDDTELKLGLWALEQVVNNEQLTVMDESKRAALESLYNRLTD